MQHLLQTPRSYQSQVLYPLWLVLHGAFDRAGQAVAMFGREASERDTFLLAPQATRPCGDGYCWSFARDAQSTQGLIENTYRLGGFANDSARLAQGFEEIQLQLQVKAWDFVGSLFPVEAGYSCIVDPLSKKVSFHEWKVASQNAVLIAPPSYISELQEHVIRLLNS